MKQALLSDIWYSQDSLTKLLESTDLDVVSKWRLSRLVGILDKLKEARRELILQFGSVDNPANPQTISVKPDREAEFSAAFDDLLNEPLDDFAKIELERLQDVALSATDLHDLRWLIEPAASD